MRNFRNFFISFAFFLVLSNEAFAITNSTVAVAGTITSGSNVLNVIDNSCKAAQAASVGWAGQYTITSCSSDPIVVGTTLVWTSPIYYGSHSWIVTSITATAGSTTPTTSTTTNSTACIYEPLDPQEAGAFFAFAFTSTLLLYFVAFGAGRVLKAIKYF